MYRSIADASILIDLFYWYTLQSTTGVSVSGTVLQSLTFMATIIQTIADQASEAQVTREDVYDILFLSLLGIVFFYMAPFVMLRAALRLEVKWKRMCIPVVRRLEPTHKERASERLERQIGWGIKGGVSTVPSRWLRFPR